MGYITDYDKIVYLYMSDLDNFLAFTMIDEILSGLSYEQVATYWVLAKEDGMDYLVDLFRFRLEEMEGDDAYFCSSGKHYPLTKNQK